MKRPRRSIWPWVLLLAASSGGGWHGWKRWRDKAPPPPEYETTSPSKNDLVKIVTSSGVVNPLSKVEIGSQISGTIQKIHVDFNSKVKAGDILCQFDPATFEAAYAQANAEKISAEADRDYLKKTLERKRQLLKDNLSTAAEFDKSESELKVAEGKVLLAEARLKKAKVDLDRCTIYAPIDGIIIDRTAELGQTIAANFNAPKLFILANDLTKMQINAKVCETDVSQVQVNQKVKFKVDAYPIPFEGEVLQLRNSPIAEENVVNYDAIIAVDNPDLKLKPGMTGDTEIMVAERKGVLTISNAALRYRPLKSDSATSTSKPASKSKDDPNTRRVYLVPENPTDEPKMVAIKIGLSDGLQTEVLEGLKEDDVVITLRKPTPGSGPPMGNPFGGGGSMPGGRR